MRRSGTAAKSFLWGVLSPKEGRRSTHRPRLQKGRYRLLPLVSSSTSWSRPTATPFFTQLWGDCLARRLDQTGETTVTRQHARDIEGEVIGKRREMYDTRRDEIEEAGLLSVAEKHRKCVYPRRRGAFA